MENKRIDVGECEYINGFCYKTGMLCKDVAFCNIRRIQQLKQENEKLCTAIRNELPEQYDKRVSEAESDIAWGVLDRNATEAEFCKNVIYETRNYIAKLKAENESYEYQLEKRVEICDSWIDVANKYKQCLDEIEAIANLKSCDECPCEKQCIDDRYTRCEDILLEQISQLIKQAKEGGE